MTIQPLWLWDSPTARAAHNTTKHWPRIAQTRLPHICKAKVLLPRGLKFCLWGHLTRLRIIQPPPGASKIVVWKSRLFQINKTKPANAGFIYRIAAFAFLIYFNARAISNSDVIGFFNFFSALIHISRRWLAYKAIRAMRSDTFSGDILPAYPWG